MHTTYSSDYRSHGSAAAGNNPEEEFNPRAQSVANFAYKEDSNRRFRPYMEDSHKIVDSFTGDPNQGYFAIFDGHGGSEAVDYCRNRMHEEFKKAIQNSAEDIPKAFTTCFQKVDNQLRLAGAHTSGTTVTACLVRRENHQRVLYLANVGDSNAVMVSSSGAQRLSQEHKGTDPGEIDRIVTSGGILIRGRVAGQLAITRSLGDHHLKTSGVSNEPYITRRVISAQDKYLVMASDGLWDVVDESQLPDGRNSNSQEVCQQLLNKALESGSQDNIAILTVFF